MHTNRVHKDYFLYFTHNSPLHPVECRGACLLVLVLVLIRVIIRTLRANLVEKCGKICLTVYFGSPKSKSFLWSADMRAKYAFLTIENFIFTTFLPLVIGSK